MRAFRSLAFGIAVLSTMLLLLAANIGVWAFSRVLDPPTLARSVAGILEEPAVRTYLSGTVADGVASAVLDQGPLPGPVRRVLDLPARPSHDALSAELARRIDGLLGGDSSDAAVALAATAFSQLVTRALDGSAGTDEDLVREGLKVDLTPIGRLVLDRIDPTGTLGGGIPQGSASIRLLDGGVMALLLPVVRLMDAVRWLLPIACGIAILLELLLARYRVHALAWVGLGCVLAGTVSLLVASGLPVLVGRSATGDPARANAITTALDGVTSSLVTQSAVLAGLGLALVVVGIAGGVVVSRGDTGGRDPRHGWDAGRLS